MGIERAPFSVSELNLSQIQEINDFILIQYIKHANSFRKTYERKILKWKGKPKSSIERFKENEKILLENIVLLNAIYVTETGEEINVTKKCQSLMTSKEE